MEFYNIVTPDEVKIMGRQISKSVDESKLYAYINEVEQLHIKPILGDRLYLHIMEVIGNPNVKDEVIDKLLNGGIYEQTICTNIERKKYFLGLKVTIAYFVYAQTIMSGDIEITRFGTVIKSGVYSEHISDKQRSDIYNNVMDVANAYLKECVEYCKAVGLMRWEGVSKINFGGITIRKIGN